MGALPVIAGLGLIALTFALTKRAVTLRYTVTEENGSYSFRVLKGEHVVHEDSRVFASMGEASTAAQIWISQNPNAGR